MLTIKFKTMKDPTFAAALNKLGSCPTYLSMEDVRAIAKVVKNIRNEMDIVQEIWIKFLKQFAKLDDKNEFVSERPGGFEIREEMIEEWKKAIVEWGENESKVQGEKINMNAIKGANLSPNEFIAIEGLLYTGPNTQPPKAVQ